MAEMTIVCGLPGTGKSTLAIALAKSIGAVHFNTDRIRHAMGRQGQYTHALKAAIYESMLLHTREALQQGKPVVLDGTFYKESLRTAFIHLAEEMQISIYWIEMVASERSVRERVSKTRPYTEADFDVYQKVKREFDPLPPDRLILDSEKLSIDDMVRISKEYIHASNLVHH